MAEQENWGKPKPPQDPNGKSQDNPILVSYFNNTFRKLLSEYNAQATDIEKNRIFCQQGNKLVFCTGLFTGTFLPIYAVFYKAAKPSDRSLYTFHRFADESDGILVDMSSLPRRANYFENSADLFFDASLDFRCNTEHILKDNLSRFPLEIKNSGMAGALLAGAIGLAKKRVMSNYRLAVPTFFERRISLLFPLHLLGNPGADLALAVVKHDDVYIGKTVLTLEMAYNDARLIVKPSNEWLLPPQ